MIPARSLNYRAAFGWKATRWNAWKGSVITQYQWCLTIKHFGNPTASLGSFVIPHTFCNLRQSGSHCNHESPLRHKAVWHGCHKIAPRGLLSRHQGSFSPLQPLCPLLMVLLHTKRLLKKNWSCTPGNANGWGWNHHRWEKPLQQLERCTRETLPKDPS